MSESAISVDCEIDTRTEGETQAFVVTVEVSGFGEGNGTLLTQHSFVLEKDLSEGQAIELIRQVLRELSSQMGIAQSRLDTFDPATATYHLDLLQ